MVWCLGGLAMSPWGRLAYVSWRCVLHVLLLWVLLKSGLCLQRRVGGCAFWSSVVLAVHLHPHVVEVVVVPCEAVGLLHLSVDAFSQGHVVPVLEARGRLHRRHRVARLDMSSELLHRHLVVGDGELQLVVDGEVVLLARRYGGEFPSLLIYL